MIELLYFINYVVGAYIYVIFAAVIMSWLISFGVININNPAVRAIYDTLQAVTEPLLRPIRNALPNFGAIDLSPIVLLFGCIFIQTVVIPNLAKLFV